MKTAIKSAYTVLLFLAEKAPMPDLVELLRKHIEPIIITITDDEEEEE